MTADSARRTSPSDVLQPFGDLRSNVRVIDVATTPLFTADECAEIVAACDPDGWRHATRSAYSSADALAGKAPVSFEDPSGKSRLEQRVPGGPDGPFMQRIAERVVEVNDEVFGFRVVGLEEPTRILRYRGSHADHVHEHIDLGPRHPLRKLGFSLLLSDPAEFEGGDLQFSGRVFERGRTQGTLTVFASFIPHLITPTIRGTRHVIVGWALGPTFV